MRLQPCFIEVAHRRIRQVCTQSLIAKLWVSGRRHVQILSMDSQHFQPGDHILRRRFGYDHHAIFDRWATAPEAYVIHHPVGKRANPLRAINLSSYCVGTGTFACRGIWLQRGLEELRALRGMVYFREPQVVASPRRASGGPTRGMCRCHDGGGSGSSCDSIRKPDIGKGGCVSGPDCSSCKVAGDGHWPLDRGANWCLGWFGRIPMCSTLVSMR
eukprot:s2893_g14.t1